MTFSFKMEYYEPNRTSQSSRTVSYVVEAIKVKTNALASHPLGGVVVIFP